MEEEPVDEETARMRKMLLNKQGELREYPGKRIATSPKNVEKEKEKYDKYLRRTRWMKARPPKGHPERQEDPFRAVEYATSEKEARKKGMWEDYEKLMKEGSDDDDFK